MSAKEDLSKPLLPGQYYHIFNRGIDRCLIFYKPDNFVYFLKKYSYAMEGYFDTYGYCLMGNHFHLLVKLKSTDEIIQQAQKDFESVNLIFYKEHLKPFLVEQYGFSEPDILYKKLTKIGVLLRFLVQGEKDLSNLSTPDQDLNFEPTDYKSRLTSGKDLSNLVHSQPESISKFLVKLAGWFVSERFRGFMLGYAKAINIQESRTGSLFQKSFRRKLVFGSNHLKQLLSYIHHNPIHHLDFDDYDAYPWSSYNAYATEAKTKVSRDEALNWFGGLDEFLKYSNTYKRTKLVDKSWLIVEDDLNLIG